MRIDRTLADVDFNSPYSSPSVSPSLSMGWRVAFRDDGPNASSHYLVVSYESRSYRLIFERQFETMVAPLFCRVQRIGDAARQENDNSIEWAPPLRVIAVVTLFASTLDLMADFLLCSRIAEFLPNFQHQIAIYAAYGYFFFTGVSVLVYVFEMIDVCLTLKYEVENVFYARLAKSLVLAAEEVPLPSLLYILFTNEPRLSLAQPVFISSWIKLVALTWGIVKFTKLRFCWPCLPLNPKHDFRENLRRMVSLTLYRVCMIIVNSCHILAIVIVIKNLIASAAGGRPIVVKE